MTAQLSSMAREIAEIPEAARRLTSPEAQTAFADAAQWLGAQDPVALITIARGSSDHAATCFAYGAGIVAGVPVASMGMSLATVYGAPLALRRVVALSISQSGGSADLVAMMRAVGEAGAGTLALTNTPASPLAQVSQRVLQVRAGPEEAVAATKSFTNSVLSGLWLLAHWRGDRALSEALLAVPERLEAALEQDVTEMSGHLAQVDRLVVLGRGPNLGLAQEIALKAMEVCGSPASAYSSAEVLHGPAAVLTDGYPVLGIGHGPEGGLGAAMERLAGQGARTLGLLDGGPSVHPALPALDGLVRAYRLLEATSRAKGRDPDAPRYLQKITSTL